MIEFDNRELNRRVDEVLFYVWDPIGVSDEPCARWEYKSYVPKILQLVEQNDDPSPIALYLSEIEKNQMGISSNTDNCNRVAELLLQHKEAIKEGLA
jgi:hypothetical protein